jgi:hypothetical protein
VRYDDQAASEQTQARKSFFAIVEAVIEEGNAGSRKHLFGILEAQPVLG